MEVDRALRATEPAAPGPYAVGFEQVGDRYVWYPVDPAQLDEDTPEAVMTYDSLWLGAPATVESSDLETVGYLPSYLDPAPSADGPFPLVVIAPGWGAGPVDHYRLATTLASRGFVVTGRPNPSDALFLPFFEQGLDPDDETLAAVLLDRADETSALIDAMQVWPGVDPERIGIVGFSLGGYTVSSLAGGVEWLGTEPDPRIDAIVNLDGVGAVWSSDLHRITAPSLVVFPDWCWNWGHLPIGSHVSYRLDAIGASHSKISTACGAIRVAYGDWLADLFGCFGDPPYPAFEEMIVGYVVAHLRTHLAGSNELQAVLTPAWALQNEPYGNFYVAEPAAYESDINPGTGWAHWASFCEQPGTSPGAPLVHYP